MTKYPNTLAILEKTGKISSNKTLRDYFDMAQLMIVDYKYNYVLEIGEVNIDIRFPQRQTQMINPLGIGESAYMTYAALGSISFNMLLSAEEINTVMAEADNDKSKSFVV